MESDIEANSPTDPINSSQPSLDLWTEDPPSKKAGIRWIVASGLLVIIAIGGWWGYTLRRQRLAEPVTAVTLTVAEGAITVSITESGVVELGNQQTFKAPGDVTVEEVLVKERQRVQAGDVLLVLRDRDLQQQLISQQIENQKATNDLRRSQEKVAEQQQKLQRAEEQFTESQSLYDRGFISEDEYLRDRTAVDDALSALKDAQVELANAELTIQNHQLTTENLLTRLEDSQITSPMDAEVLKVEVKPGDGVQQEGRLLTIGDPQQETIRLQLTTLNAAKVRLNMPVRVQVIGPDPTVYSGRISRVSPQALIGEGGSQGGEGQSAVEAEAILDEPSGVLIPGSAVSVEIILEERQQVLTVPLSAVNTNDGQPYVWIRNAAGQAQQQTVTLGLQNLDAAEVMSGLQVGDEVVVSLPPDADLVPGVPLSPAGTLPAQ